MPIAPCFDPDSGASGGAAGGGGGADLSALGFEQVNITDGSWTQTDPDSLVQSTAYASGVNQVVFNALGVGSTDYAWAAGTNQKAPRWTKALTAVDGAGSPVQLKSGDTFILQTVARFATPANRYAAEIVCASSVDGTATTAGANDAMGGLIRYNASGNIGYGIFTFNGYTALTSASNAESVCTVIHSGARGQGGGYINLDSSGGAVNGQTRSANMTYSNGTTDMRIMVGVGTNSSATISAGDDAKFELYYRVVRFTLPS
jgi:hypothetical protein